MGSRKCVEGCSCGRHKPTVHSNETRAKISRAKMGHEVSLEARRKIGEASRGRIASAETRVKLVEIGTTHGHHGRGRRTPTYRSWDGMIQRCTNPKSSGWKAYGAVGITVCERWRFFQDFLTDMGERPAGTSLDRIDNAVGYLPGNCRWASHSEQMKNRPNFNPDKRSSLGS